MSKLFVAFLIHLLCGTANALDLIDLIDACRTSGTEHVYLFTDHALSNGIDISQQGTRDTVGWEDRRVGQRCAAEYVALAHCHFSDYPRPNFPSSSTDSGGDIISLVLHEMMCAHARLIPGNERTPIEHMVVVVESGEVTGYQLGPYFRQLIRGFFRAPQFTSGGMPTRSVFGRESRRFGEYDTLFAIPPHVQAVMGFETLADSYLPKVQKSGVEPSLPEMFKGFETHFIAREWRLR